MIHYQMSLMGGLLLRSQFMGCGSREKNCKLSREIFDAWIVRIFSFVACNMFWFL